MQCLNVLSAAADVVGEMPVEMVEAAKQGKLYVSSSVLTLCNSVFSLTLLTLLYLPASNTALSPPNNADLSPTTAAGIPQDL